MKFNLKTWAKFINKAFLNKLQADSADVQAIFNKVIDAGYYDPCMGMCTGLDTACKKGIITEAERIKAQAAITKQLQGYAFMHSLLTVNKLPAKNEDLIKFYRNWNSRPQLKGII